MPEFDRRIVHKLDAKAELRAHVYKRDPEELRLDVYTPPGPAERRPVVFLVHGGPVPLEMPAPTSWGVFQSWAQLLAASGMVACVFNHRLHALGDYARSQADIADAIAYVRAHEPAVDPSRVGVWYFSGAGPQLSWLLRERPAHVRCAAAFYAMLDVRHLVPADATAEQHAAAATLSPATLLRGCDLPLFVARAGLDSPMVNVGLDNFVREALANDTALDLLNHPQGEHVFEVKNDLPRSHEIIHAALAFTRHHLNSR